MRTSFGQTAAVCDGRPAAQGHPVYNNGATPLHDSIYALAGEAGARKRLVLYRMLLRHMSQVHLYKLHQKLHTELLPSGAPGAAPKVASQLRPANFLRVSIHFPSPGWQGTSK